MNKRELKKIMYKFNSMCNRLRQANYNDYADTLRKFVRFLKDTPIIYDYIVDAGECEQDIQKEFSYVLASRGRRIFSLGDTDDEEVRNVFAIINYIVENNVIVPGGIGMSYSSSMKYQDHVQAFNDRVIMVLITHIEDYLTIIGIDMGLDETTNYSITVKNGQAIVAMDNATVIAKNEAGLDANQLTELINAIRLNADSLSNDDRELVDRSLGEIEEETQKKEPRENILNKAISVLKGINGSSDLMETITELIKLLTKLFF